MGCWSLFNCLLLRTFETPKTYSRRAPSQSNFHHQSGSMVPKEAIYFYFFQTDQKKTLKSKHHWFNIYWSSKTVLPIHTCGNSTWQAQISYILEMKVYIGTRSINPLQLPSLITRGHIYILVHYLTHSIWFSILFPLKSHEITFPQGLGPFLRPPVACLRVLRLRVAHEPLCTPRRWIFWVYGRKHGELNPHNVGT